MASLNLIPNYENTKINLNTPWFAFSASCFISFPKMSFRPSVVTLGNFSRSVFLQIPDLGVNMCILHHIRQNTLHISTTDSVISFSSLLWPYYEYSLPLQETQVLYASPSVQPYIYLQDVSVLAWAFTLSDGTDKNTSWGSNSLTITSGSLLAFMVFPCLFLEQRH